MAIKTSQAINGFISADPLEAEAEEREPVGMMPRRRGEDDEEEETEAAE